jgi:large subunit ribosomal protein L11
MDQVRAIATEKLPDLNTNNIENAMNSVVGAAKSMGVAVK